MTWAGLDEYIEVAGELVELRENEAAVTAEIHLLPEGSITVLIEEAAATDEAFAEWMDLLGLDERDVMLTGLAHTATGRFRGVPVSLTMCQPPLNLGGGAR